MRVFTTVVEGGSFSAAAGKLDMSRAMVSKHVARLEARLRTRLLQRTTRKLTLTPSGAAYHDRRVQILADIADAEEGTLREATAPSGELRVTIPVSFGILRMGPLLSAYLKRFPDVKVDVLLSDRRVDLIEEGIDVALRIGALPESGLVARRLGSDRIVIAGSPEYLQRHGTPRTPADLARHNCLRYIHAAAGDDWKMTGPDGVAHSVRVSGNLRATNGDIVKLAALGGVGLMRQPMFLCAAELRAGRLVEVLADHHCGELGIHAVYPSRRHLSAKVRSFVDMLAEGLAEDPPGRPPTHGTIVNGQETE